MKKFSLRHLLVLAGSFALATVSSYAADGTWTAAANGNWTDTGNWASGTVASGVGASATLQGATGRTITLDADYTIGQMALDGWTGTRWTISGTSVLTLDNGGGTPTIAMASYANNDQLQFDVKLAGTDGVKFTGARVTLKGANTLTGGIEIANRALYAWNPGTLNGNTLTFSDALGSTPVLGVVTNGDYTSAMTLNTTNSRVTWSGGGGGSVTLSGSIGESGGTRNLELFSDGNDVRYTLTGSSSFNGNVSIGRHDDLNYVIVRAENSNALGTGSGTVSFRTGNKTHTNDALELAGGITIAKALELRGAGNGGNGSLRNVSGTNTWSGTISIGSSANPRIGVDSGTQLTVSGIISGSATGGLNKSGDGTLVLSGDNVYTSGTIIVGGTLVASHDNALGTGDVTVGDSTGTDLLRISTGTNLSTANLSLTSSAHLGFSLNAGFTDTGITVGGDQTGSGTYVVDIFNGGGMQAGTYTLMTVTGTSAATGFSLGNLPTGFESSTLSWSSGTLQLLAIPEPSVALSLILAAGGLLIARRRHRA